MNKIKEQLRLKMLGQLSDEKTDLDVDNAYSVVKKSVLSFSNFLRENYSITYNNEVEDNLTGDIRSAEELFKIWNDGVD